MCVCARDALACASHYARTRRISAAGNVSPASPSLVKNRNFVESATRWATKRAAAAAAFGSSHQSSWPRGVETLPRARARVSQTQTQLVCARTRRACETVFNMRRSLACVLRCAGPRARNVNHVTVRSIDCLHTACRNERDYCVRHRRAQLSKFRHQVIGLITRATGGRAGGARSTRSLSLCGISIMIASLLVCRLSAAAALSPPPPPLPDMLQQS